MTKIGIFDSGFGGLTVLRDIVKRLPQYDYVYLGDNARAPYGTRSFDMVYRFTLQAVSRLFDMGCPLVILACNTASAKALRSIQQRDLPQMSDPTQRVLGVIRPTVEALGNISRNGHIGILATPGTIASNSYNIEISHLYPEFKTVGQACPLWVPLVENGVTDNVGAEYFIKKDIQSLFEKDPEIDTVILGCTHYPMIAETIRKFLPAGVSLISQGEIVAESLADYLLRHPEMENRLNKHLRPTIEYYTTETPDRFDSIASTFMECPVSSRQLSLN